MARIEARIPKQTGTSFKNVSGQIASLPVFREQAHDPAMVAIGKSVISYGASGGAVFGPVGAVIGGAYGLVSSLFGISHRNEAERRAQQERYRQYLESKRQYEESFVERRRQQISGLRAGLVKEVKDLERYAHAGLSEQVSNIQSPKRALSFHQTGIIPQMQTATWDKLLVAESSRLAFKTEQAIKLRQLVVGDIDNYQERLEEEGYSVAKEDGKEIYKLKGSIKRLEDG